MKSSAAIGKDAKEGPSFGKTVAASENAPGQLMHDISKGRFEYIGDFMSSLNRGPVKLDYGKEAKPLSEKEKEMDELNERNLKLIQRSLLLGSLMAATGCYLGWVLTKWYYGVNTMNEFSEVMKHKMPKVSGDMKESMIGRRMQEASEHSRDSISENAELTDWRRSLRNKFNTKEGAEIARHNSIMMAERREQERVTRRTKSEEQLIASTVITATEADGADAEGRLNAAAVAPPVTETPEIAPPTTVRRLQRATSQVFVDLEKGASSAISSGVDLARSVSGVAETSVKSMVRRASQLTPSQDAGDAAAPATAVASEPKVS